MFLDSRKRKTQSHSGRPIRTSRTAHTPTTFPVRGRLQPHACLLLLNRRRYLTATPQPATHRDAAAATPTPAFYSDITAGLLPRLSHSDTDIGLLRSAAAGLLPQRRPPPAPPPPVPESRVPTASTESSATVPATRAAAVARAPPRVVSCPGCLTRKRPPIPSMSHSQARFLPFLWSLVLPLRDHRRATCSL